MARRVRPHPNTWVTGDGVWPTGPFQPDAPPYATAVARLAGNLQKALDTQGLTQRAVARAAGLTPSTVNELLRGMLIPDAATIAALEDTLDITLWPTRGPR